MKRKSYARKLFRVNLRTIVTIIGISFCLVGCKSTQRDPNEELRKRKMINVPLTTGITSLHKSVNEGDLKGVQAALKLDKSEINVGEPRDFKTALCVAAELGHWEIVKTLVKAGADINLVDKTGRSPLMFAVARDQLEMVSLLLESGANANAQRVVEKGITPLILASVMNRPKIVKALLRKRALVDQPDFRGRTALMEASFHGHESVVSLLIKVGANMNAKDRNGGSAMMFAAMMNRVEAAKTLVKAEAIVDLPDNQGRTPLMGAAMMGHRPMVQFLLKAGANKNFRSRSGETALSIAQGANKTEVAQVLKD